MRVMLRGSEAFGRFRLFQKTRFFVQWLRMTGCTVSSSMHVKDSLRFRTDNDSAA